MLSREDKLEIMQEADRVAAVAATIARADEVRQWPSRWDPQACLVCGRETELAIVVVHKTAIISKICAVPLAVVGVCAQCRDAASESHAAAVSDLVEAAARVEKLLSLVRHRAERELSGWWGELGNAALGDVDGASVAVRRAIERLGAKP